MSDERLTLTVADVAVLLGLSRGKTYELIREGVIPAKRLGRLIKIYRPEFEAWLQESEWDRRRGSDAGAS